MNPLAGALREAMVGSPHDLVVLDRDTDTWQRRPWPEVHGIAEHIAAYLLGRDLRGAVGLVGEPTVEIVAAIQGSWLAGVGPGGCPERTTVRKQPLAESAASSTPTQRPFMAPSRR